MTLDDCIKMYEIWASDDRISPDIREEHKQVVDWLKELKQLREQTRWIPVSKGLPKKVGWYLTSIGDIVSTYPFDGNNFRLRDNTCIIYVDAWKPLPESYKPADSNCDSCEYQNEVDGSNCYECVKGIRNNHKADSEKE